jgi:hypothetical protein
MRQDLCFDECVDCAIGKSKICNGQGLFALRQFNVGDVVVDYSKTCKNWQLCKHETMETFYKDFMWWVGIDEVYCKLADLNSVFMRANHSDTPNTNWLIAEKMLVANSVIFPGDEITFNYTKEIAPQTIKSKPPKWVKSVSQV